MPNLSEVTSVTISIAEYAQLIRESEKLAIIKRQIEKANYITTGDLKLVLDIEEREDESIGSCEGTENI